MQAFKFYVCNIDHIEGWYQTQINEVSSHSACTIVQGAIIQL